MFASSALFKIPGSNRSPVIDCIHQLPWAGRPPKQSPPYDSASVKLPETCPSYVTNRSNPSKFQSFSEPSLFKVKFSVGEPINVVT